MPIYSYHRNTKYSENVNVWTIILGIATIILFVQENLLEEIIDTLIVTSLQNHINAAGYIILQDLIDFQQYGAKLDKQNIFLGQKPFRRLVLVSSSTNSFVNVQFFFIP